MSNDKLNQIEIRYHYIWDMVQRGVVRLQHILYDEQLVGILQRVAWCCGERIPSSNGSRQIENIELCSSFSFDFH